MIAFDYLESENSLSFVLNEGWHNVGIILSDLAGNENDIQEKTNIHVGFFWLYVILGATVLVGGLTTFVLIRRKRKNAMAER